MQPAAHEGLEKTASGWNQKQDEKVPINRPIICQEANKIAAT